MILSAVLLFCLACSCAPAAPSSEGEDSQSADGTQNGTVAEVTGIGGHTDGMLIDVHLSYLPYEVASAYPFSGGEKADLLHLSAMFLCYQRPDTVAVAGENGEGITVSAALLERTMQLLFGDDVHLSDYNEFLNPQWGDAINAETGDYTFSSFEGFGLSAAAYLSMESPVDVTDEAELIEARVTVVGYDGTEKALTYTFRKTVYEKYLYYTLETVTEG